MYVQTSRSGQLVIMFSVLHMPRLGCRSNRKLFSFRDSRRGHSRHRSAASRFPPRPFETSSLISAISLCDSRRGNSRLNAHDFGIFQNTPRGHLDYIWKSFRLHMDVIWTTPGRASLLALVAFLLVEHPQEEMRLIGGSHLEYIWRSCGQPLKVI